MSQKSPPESLYKLALRSDFPKNCIGEVVDYLERTYRVVGTAADGSRLMLVPQKGGNITQVSIKHLKVAAKQRTAPA